MEIVDGAVSFPDVAVPEVPRIQAAAPKPVVARSGRRVNLVLEGGGVKGIGLVGAVSVLEENGYKFERIAGTSAGAIVGALIAVGYTSAELKELMAGVDYLKFEDSDLLQRVFPPAGLLALWTQKGLFKGDYFHSWISEKLLNKGKTRFEDLRIPGNRRIPHEQRYKLVVMSSDISRERLARLPWDFQDPSHPRDGQLIADSVRASMSIPFFYRPFNLNIYPNGPSVMVDGGLLSDFPIDVFDASTSPKGGIPTIGIKLSRRQPTDAFEYKGGGDIKFAVAILNTMASWNDRLDLESAKVLGRTIFVDTDGVSLTDFHISKERQEWLYQSGRDAALQWLRRLNES